MGQSFISPAGEIVLHRRKIKPTHIERTIWGEGQAESLKCVVPSPFGNIGGLNCWEHCEKNSCHYFLFFSLFRKSRNNRRNIWKEERLIPKKCSAAPTPLL